MAGQLAGLQFFTASRIDPPNAETGVVFGRRSTLKKKTRDGFSINQRMALD
ncbi:hypothetical protein [Paraburkholderia bryophila]|uniref:Uncharacterized protein n=1 Tax=Paraburkholderia bryophila TaxID=420952 RepID=A0A7Y9WF91_9BURK|nr:hypothetical protein [Paraburkholderia bryophila]NYH19769.1 hypothetical protein [Paraburkholderia bryophila]